MSLRPALTVTIAEEAFRFRCLDPAAGSGGSPGSPVRAAPDAAPVL